MFERMTEASSEPAARGRTLVGYAAMLGLTIAAYLVLRSYGLRLLAPAPAHSRLLHHDPRYLTGISVESLGKLSDRAMQLVRKCLAVG